MGRFLSIAVMLDVVVPAHALAWGTEGHQVIAMLAQRHLAPQAAAAAHDLLGGRQLADVALWADEIKASARPETRPWHYVLIPDASPGFDERRDCPGRACVVDKIDDFHAVLANARAPRLQRIEALELVHYIADLHQPLHCEDHGDDLSHGIAVHDSGMGRTDFHVIWDTGVVRTDMAGRDAASYAARLDTLAEPHRTAWSAGTPADWANESHAIARKIYAELGSRSGSLTPALSPKGGEGVSTPLEIGTHYGSAHSAILEQQLERAGTRLAWVLNDSLSAPAGASR